MFLPVKSNTGALLPWEYLGAAAGTYQAGQMLTVMTRVDGDYIYETTLKAQYDGAKPGVKMQVDADGVTASEGAGNFELVEVSGTNAGDTVRGRFV